MSRAGIVLLPILLLVVLSQQGVHGLTYYEYFLPGSVVNSGLVAEGDTFTLNGKPIVILSGAFHYFRTHPAHWRDTLKKLRAAGLNAVETYVPWNLHEPRQGVFDYGVLGEAMSVFLDVRTFVQMAQEEDLFVIFRPGPYICSEWDFGGLPSYLLRDNTMQVRSSYENFKMASTRFFNDLLPRVVDLQVTRGGPIIAVQIENEFGHFGYGDIPRDTRYLEFLKELLVTNGFGESLFFTSDTPTKTQDLGALPGVLQTANFNTNVHENLSLLKEIQPNRPLMVMEFWSGWFDHWLSTLHAGTRPAEFASTLESILNHSSSVNMYMFIGGTNFGFMAGANTVDVWPFYAPETSTYDYDAPLTEAGDYSEKYQLAVDVMAKYNPLQGIVDHPQPPPIRVKAAYSPTPVIQAMNLSTLLDNIPEKFFTTTGPVNMEALPMNGDSGQAHGYTLYTSSVFLDNSTLKIHGHVRDMAMVLVDGQLISEPFNNLQDVTGFGFWAGRDQELAVGGDGVVAKLSILVENLGRVNFGQPHSFAAQKKGLWEGPITVDGNQINDWTIVPLELKKVDNLVGWGPFRSYVGPAMYQAQLEVLGTPLDTFVDMRNWNKGVVFVNGFNLGRYWKEGPPKTLYLPAPLLKQGINEIVVFEQYQPGVELRFLDAPILQGPGP